MRVYRSLGASYDTLIAGMAYKTDTLKADTNWGRDHLAFVINGTGQFCVTVSATGQLEARRGHWNGTLLASTSALININTWYYIELKVYIHDTSGTYDIRLNGSNVLSGSSIDTKASGTAGANQIAIGGYAYIKTCYFDDIYVCDTTGTVANDLLGDCKVETRFPDGAGNSTDFTASAGSNYQCVDETSPNSDTDYVYDDTVGNHDTYTFGNMSTIEGSIYGVQTSVFARKDDAGSRKIKTVVRSNGTDYTPGAEHTLGDAYSYYSDVHESDPDTSSAWTIAGINAAEFGPKVES
jgi:hypothetical protein